MKWINVLLMVFVVSGCTSVSDLSRVKRGEGRQVIIDLDQKEMLVLGQKALENCGLEIKRVNQKKDRIEILASQPKSLEEYGSVYGLYLYDLGNASTEVYLVRKNKVPAKGFSRDATEEILSKLDELVLNVMESKKGN